MPELVAPRRTLLFALACALTLGAAPAAAQREQTEMLNAVMKFRAAVIHDSTSFDACTVYNAVGRPVDFPAGFDRIVLPLLDRTAEPCAQDSARAANRWPRRFVRVESVTPGATGGPTVVLLVTKYEYQYREAYLLRPVDSHREVAEVRTYGIVQYHPAPPGRRPAPSPR